MTLNDSIDNERYKKFLFSLKRTRYITEQDFFCLTCKYSWPLRMICVKHKIPIDISFLYDNEQDFYLYVPNCKDYEEK